MTAEVRKLWVPEQPENQNIKLECLRIASVMFAGSGQSQRVMLKAQEFYNWIVTQGKK